MSVFTPLDRDDISKLVEKYALGVLTGFQGISAGSENTNYFVDTTGGHYVLTLVERGDVSELPFLVQLLDCLHQNQLPVPFVHADRQGRQVQQLKGRAALLQPRLPGAHVDTPDVAHCAAVGEVLARLHKSGQRCGLQRAGDRDPGWVLLNAQEFLDARWQAHADWLAPVLYTLEHWLQSSPGLPVTVIHGDLFRDNVLFENNKVSGLIDFHNAASGWRLMDLAVCVNDWCVDERAGELQLNQQRLQAMLHAWQQDSPMSSAERSAWPMVLQLAALRFWTSRQQYLDQHPVKPGVLIKDPERFCQVLQLHLNQKG